MKTQQVSIKIVLSLSLAALLLIAPFGTALANNDKTTKTSASAIRVAPPAPVFDESARLGELATRRARVAEKIGRDALLVMFSTEPRVYTNDVDYEYRQENNLYYLTNLKQKGATLVLMPGNAQMPEILFLPRRDPAAETWTGHMYSPEEARQLSGVKEIWEAGQFEPFMRALRMRMPFRPKPEGLLMTSAATTTSGSAQPVTPPVPLASQTTGAAEAATPARPVTGQTPANLSTTNAPTTSTTAAGATSQYQGPSPGLPPGMSAMMQSADASGYQSLFEAMGKGTADLYLLIPRGGEEESREYKQEQSFAARMARSASGFNVRNASNIFTELRLRKSPMELQLLQHAIDISAEAHQRAQTVSNKAQWEYEVDAEVAYTFKRRNADHWGYPSIVGCGPNATTLHYEEAQSPVRTGQLMLMDVGAEYGHYSADVTRTFPVNGKFSTEQADIYNIVYNAQEAAAKVIRPGVMFPEVHKAATEVIKDGLLKLGLITDRNSNQYRIWFMHGTAHWLGMNVHDVGGRDVKLDEGMVFTNEPGIYIREDALEYLPKTPETERFIAAIRPAFEKYKGIGVRIEDDMVVTKDGVRWMTEALPRSIPDIEAFMAKARRENLR